ncbi:MAG TPA: hypothetical protein VFA34_13425 [Actinomycetota bacterium]|jgi:hypothetical protein|nr:hypothetical protein [Actinomycetota bacterium]
MRKLLAAAGLALAGLLFGVGLGRSSVTASPPAVPAIVEQSAPPDGFMRVLDDDTEDPNCHEDEVASTHTVQRSA